MGGSLHRILFASMAVLAGTLSCIGATADFVHRVRTADNAATHADSATPEREKAGSAKANELTARAEQHHSKREWKAAVADATEALKIDSRSARAYNVRGDALTQLRQFERAIADLTEAIRLDPQMDVAYINRGAAYEQSGRDDLALADYDTATKLYPDWEIGHRVAMRYCSSMAATPRRYRA